MRLFRNVAFVILLLVIGGPAVLRADGSDFCFEYGPSGFGCYCSWGGNNISALCNQYQDCGAELSDFCWDALIECNDTCFHWQSDNNGQGSIWPQVFSCSQDYECTLACECPDLM